MKIIINIFILTIAVLSTCFAEKPETTTAILAVETPLFFSDQPSPLLKPEESLQKKEYYDFLSTLYRHDKTKAGLFAPNVVPSDTPALKNRSKRTIIFRPLFVYRQKQIKKQKRRRRY